jgi:FtsP/CotA-like multicopper oxidase with cupredoxin domain
MTITVDLLAAVCAHLAEFELPAIASVHVGAVSSAPQVTVQLACHELSAIAQGLLAWADTVTQVTAQACRVPEGDSVHLSVTGLLPGGASILVYGGLWLTHRGLGADLALDATTTIPLPTLRHAAIVVEKARA